VSFLLEKDNCFTFVAVERDFDPLTRQFVPKVLEPATGVYYDGDRPPRGHLGDGLLVLDSFCPLRRCEPVSIKNDKVNRDDEKADESFDDDFEILVPKKRALTVWHKERVKKNKKMGSTTQMRKKFNLRRKQQASKQKNNLSRRTKRGELVTFGMLN
jgi:hypothetical protein